MRKISALVTIIFVLTLTTLTVWHTRPIWVSFLKLSPQHTLNTLTLESSTDPNPTLARFNNKPIVAPSINLADTQTAKTPILGKTTSNKHIEVDLTNQRLYAYEGVNKVFEFLISSGKWARTPTGKFTIWVKLRATKMEGGKKELGTYYYLPNVPYVMFFANSDIPKWRGFGIHGTYWHSNFGHPMSHGCINMKTEEAEKLYYWTNPDLNGKSSVSSSPENPGTEVFIYGQAPWI